MSLFEYRFNIYQPSEGGFSVYVRAKLTSSNPGGYYLGFSEEDSETTLTNAELVQDSIESSTEWAWVKSNTIVRLGQGMVTLRVFPNNRNVAISSVVLVPRQDLVTPTLSSYGAKCLPVCEPPRVKHEVEINPGDAVDECGGQQCCAFDDEANSRVVISVGHWKPHVSQVVPIQRWGSLGLSLPLPGSRSEMIPNGSPLWEAAMII